jgi:phosphoglycolate phosphatase
MNIDHPNKKLVLFDFDGVLINTLGFSYQIHKDKNPNFTWEKFQDFSNGNFHEEYNKNTKDGKHIHPIDFYKQYQSKIEVLNIDDILRNAIIELSSSYIMIIISSTRSDLINDFLNKENTAIYFSDILGNDIHSSKVVKIKSTLEKYGMSPNNAVIVTDTLGDIREANECSVPSIAVTWGLHGRENLERGNPSLIIDDPQDLVLAIKNVLK